MDSSFPESTGEETPDMMEGTETALVPRSVFGKEPEIGNICTFKVIGIHEDEVEVEYAGSDEGGGEEIEETAEMKIEKLPRSEY
jgi:hypothetical protein